MPRGGRRNGAGRKPGSVTEKTREFAEAQAESPDLKPLFVMQFVMNWHFENKRYAEAAEVARDLAPYMHARLGSVTIKGDRESPLRLVEELVVVHADGAPAGNLEAAPEGPPGAARLPEV